MPYVVLIEKDETGFRAYVPDLPGCIAAAKTREDVEQLIREGITLHLEALAEDGDAIPQLTVSVITVDAPFPALSAR